MIDQHDAAVKDGQLGGGAREGRAPCFRRAAVDFRAAGQAGQLAAVAGQLLAQPGRREESDLEIALVDQLPRGRLIGPEHPDERDAQGHGGEGEAPDGGGAAAREQATPPAQGAFPGLAAGCVRWIRSETAFIDVTGAWPSTKICCQASRAICRASDMLANTSAVTE